VAHSGIFLHKKRLTGKSSKPFTLSVAQILGNGFLSFPLERVRMPPPVFVRDCFHKTLANIKKRMEKTKHRSLFFKEK
jgi:hypothetical protein